VLTPLFRLLLSIILVLSALSANARGDHELSTDPAIHGGVSETSVTGAESAPSNLWRGSPNFQVGVTHLFSHSDEIPIQALPVEARTTLTLIDQGGLFPFRRDGVVFQNRESRLPSRTRGCYREYTVPTPGAGDRGARRIIAACDGVRYYSDDHYRSFRKIRR